SPPSSTRSWRWTRATRPCGRFSATTRRPTATPTMPKGTPTSSRTSTIPRSPWATSSKCEPALMRRVAVLMGGISPEHPVSLASGCGLLAHIDAQRFQAFPVLISRAGVWIWPENPSGFPSGLTAEQAGELLASPPAGWRAVPFADMPAKVPFPGADVYFIALHGVGGEDGTLQAALEAAGKSFTGSGSAASALALDKIRSKEKYREAGIPTAPWLVFPAGVSVVGAADRVERELGLPAVVKHPAGGSSIGVTIARARA